MKRGADTRTADLFAVPAPRAPMPGALNIDRQLRALLSRILKECPLNRYDVEARMSELTGDEVTKYQLDAWTAESREQWRFPLEYLPAFEVATDTHEITAWIACLRGGQLHIGRDVLHAELGRLERQRDDAAKRIKQLKTQMGEGE